jgi:spermidine synthase
LGAGSLSLYAHQPDTITYYEVSPAVVELAQSQFRYLKSHTGKTEIKLGDGRFLLQKEAALTNTAKLQLLVLDAFSNDALPTHLLTKQAFELYRQRLAPDGLLAFNITNRNLNLAPTLFATSKQLGLKPLLVENESVRWLVLFPESIPLPNWPGGRDRLSESQTISSQHGWTDDFASPIQAMRW